MFIVQARFLARHMDFLPACCQSVQFGWLASAKFLKTEVREALLQSLACGEFCSALQYLEEV